MLVISPLLYADEWLDKIFSTLDQTFFLKKGQVLSTNFQVLYNKGIVHKGSRVKVKKQQRLGVKEGENTVLSNTSGWQDLFDISKGNPSLETSSFRPLQHTYP